MKQFDYRFCNSANTLFKDQIINTIARGLFKGNAIETVKERYEDLIDNFELPCKEWKLIEGQMYNQFKDLLIPISHVNDLIDQSHSNIGIDLPVWFNYNESLKKIMLVAMEPKRSNQVSTEGYASLGSPFALGNLKYQNKPSWRTIYKFIRQLIEENSSVYVTDIGKIYSIHNGKKYSGNYELNKKVFLEEVSLFSPDCIMTFGNGVYENVTKILDGNSSRIIPVAHPASYGDKKYYNILMEKSQ